jgi:hypothetical protein
MPYDNERGVPHGKKDSHVVRPNYSGLGSCSWSDIPTALVVELVTLVTRHGAAIMFGATSDGGALSLCILNGSDKVKEYPRTPDEVSSLVAWLREDYFPTPLSTKK